MVKNRYVIFCISALLLCCISSSGCQKRKDNVEKAIHINQLGYYPDAPKYCVVVGSDEDEFYVKNSAGQVVYSGELEDKGIWELSEEDVHIGIFSALKNAGTYYIVVDDIGKSHPFEINTAIYAEALKGSLKSFYFQRASQKLDKKYAGKWAREAGHADRRLKFDEVPGKEGKKKASPGGWYDAGDYGKYVVNAGVTVATMLALYELYPEAVGDDLNIPESKNRKSDLLDEIKYELDWMKTMQDRDGGVFFKVGPNQWAPKIMPKNDTIERFVIGKSTTSTLNFAANMAQAGRIYASYNRSYAADCVQRAGRAWKWAVAHPEIAHPKNQKGTGSYDDTDYRDEFVWAAAELYLTTGKEKYHTYIVDHLSLLPIIRPADWQKVANLAYYSLATVKNRYNKLDISTQNIIKKQIIQFADTVLNTIDSSPYRIPINDSFEWGSNGTIGNYAVALFYAYKITDDKKYLHGASETIDYIFGKNATGYSFLTGYGDKQVMYPHHRISNSDGVKAPIPGLVTGGANQRRQDGIMYRNYEPAKTFLDNDGSFSSNEPAINQNAPLVFLLGALEAEY